MKLRPAPDDQHRGHGAVGLGRVDRGDQAAAHVDAEGVDGRVVDGHDQHVGLALEVDGIRGGRGVVAMLLCLRRRTVRSLG